MGKIMEHIFRHVACHTFRFLGEEGVKATHRYSEYRESTRQEREERRAQRRAQIQHDNENFNYMQWSAINDPL
jgi:hypothetical protein